MCRWMAWHGQPILVEELLFKSQHGLIDQSLHSRMGAETTNGDGFGLGWYGTGDGPGVFHSVSPAWGDANLRHLAAHIESPLFMAHVRATSGGAIQGSNCHPFRYGDWLFVHNGVVNEFGRIRRDLMMAIDPSLFEHIQGSTDSEVLFHLALGFGLEDDPLGALEKTLGLVESLAARQGIAHALQASIGVSDGVRLWAVRYATDETPRTLFHSADADSVQAVHPDDARLRRMHEGDVLVVSEPFSDLPGLWVEIPPSTALVVDARGDLEQRPFEPAGGTAGGRRRAQAAPASQRG
jgi:predicted glutamine amidotransferase